MTTRKLNLTILNLLLIENLLSYVPCAYWRDDSLNGSIAKEIIHQYSGIAVSNNVDRSTRAYDNTFHNHLGDCTGFKSDLVEEWIHKNRGQFFPPLFGIYVISLQSTFRWPIMQHAFLIKYLYLVVVAKEIWCEYMHWCRVYSLVGAEVVVNKRKEVLLGHLGGMVHPVHRRRILRSTGAHVR